MREYIRVNVMIYSVNFLWSDIILLTVYKYIPFTCIFITAASTASQIML